MIRKPCQKHIDCRSMGYRSHCLMPRCRKKLYRMLHAFLHIGKRLHSFDMVACRKCKILFFIFYQLSGKRAKIPLNQLLHRLYTISA